MKRPFLYIGGLFVLGELASQLWKESRQYSALIFISGIILIISGIKNKSGKYTEKSSNAWKSIIRVNLLLFYFLSFFSLGAGLFWGYEYRTQQREGILYEVVGTDREVTVNAYIKSVEKTQNGFRLILKTSEGNVLAFINDPGDEISPGRYIKIKGTVEYPDGSTNPGAMDMEKYYLGKGINYVINTKHFSVKKDKENQVVVMLYRMRCNMEQILNTCFDKEDAGIICTMILGEKSGVYTEDKVLFQRSGIAHILAISGLHIALITGIVEWILAKLGIRRKRAILLAMIIVSFYGIMTGLSESTLRALIMLSLYRLAFLLKRYPDMPTSMMEAIIVMIIINPCSLMSGSLIMSFAAVMGIYSGNVLFKKIYKREKYIFLQERVRGLIKKSMQAAVMGISINIWTFPLIIYNYYEVPLLSMLLNIFVIPLLTVVVVCGFITGILGGIFSGITGGISGEIVKPFIWICSHILDFYRWLCGIAIKVPFGVAVTGHAELWQVIIIYICIISVSPISWVFLKKFRAGKAKRLKSFKGWKAFASYLMLASLSMLLIRLYNISSSRVIFLDVGQGDGSIIHISPFERNASEKNIDNIWNGADYIIDCGSTSNEEVGRYTLIPALKYYGVTSVDCGFISHTDEDHVNGILYLLEHQELYGIKVKNIALAYETEEDEIVRRIKKSMVDKVDNEDGETDKILGLKEKDVIDGRFYILYPSGNENVPHSGNEYSLVISYISPELEILYTGDIGLKEEQSLLEKGAVDIIERGAVERKEGGAVERTEGTKDGEMTEEETTDGVLRILKCAHHGSNYSSGQEFLEAYDPDITIISCGKKNNYGHPGEQTLFRLYKQGSAIYRTDQRGAVIITW